MSNVDTEEAIGTLEDNDIWEIAVMITIIIVVIMVVPIIMVTNGMVAIGKVTSEEEMDVTLKIIDIIG